MQNQNANAIYKSTDLLMFSQQQRHISKLLIKQSEHQAAIAEFHVLHKGLITFS